MQTSINEINTRRSILYYLSFISDGAQFKATLFYRVILNNVLVPTHYKYSVLLFVAVFVKCLRCLVGLAAINQN